MLHLFFYLKINTGDLLENNLESFKHFYKQQFKKILSIKITHQNKRYSWKKIILKNLP